MSTLTAQGKLQKIFFVDKNFFIGQILTSTQQRVTISGSVTKVPLLYTEISVTGKPFSHKKYGEQIRFSELSIVGGTKETVDLPFRKHVAEYVYNQFGATLPQILRDDPFSLITVPGVLLSELEKAYPTFCNTPSHYGAKIWAAVRENILSSGSTIVAQSELQHQYFPELSKADWVNGIQYCIEHEWLVTHAKGISTPTLVQMEAEIAKLLNETLVQDAILPKPLKVSDISSEQQEALEQVQRSRITVLSGGPGTGKTHTIQAILRAFPRHRVQLLAPTGRAARNLTELSQLCGGPEAQTLHKYFSIEPNEGNDLPTKLRLTVQNLINTPHIVVVDEASMLDLQLGYLLTQLLRFPLHIVLVGDHCQLPPVSPGSLFSLCEQQGVPRITLTKNFRHDSSSLTQFAADILTGALPNVPYAQVSVVTHANQQVLREQFLQNYKTNLGSNSIQVISPCRATLLGTEQINKEIRKLANPTADKPFSPGDRIIITKNTHIGFGATRTYIVNGQQGLIVPSTQRILVQLSDDLTVEPPKDVLEYAWCSTIHKCQGSEFDIVYILLPFDTSPLLLNRTLLYTAATRARAQIYIYAHPDALNLCLTNNAPARINTLS